MARINTYQLDTVLHENDKVIGTDQIGTVTKNFKLADIATLFSKGLISVGGQAGYKFSEIIEQKAFSGPADNTAISTLTTLKFSEVDAANNNLENFILEYNLKRILLFENDEPDNYGVFDVTNLNEDPDNRDYYDFTLNHVSSNGNLKLDQFYTLSLFGGGFDKHYIHTQNNSSATWNVQHNLGKRPAVSITVSGGKQGFADVVYTDENSLTLNFSVAKSGYTYLN